MPCWIKYRPATVPNFTLYGSTHLLHPLIRRQHLFSVLQIQIINKAADIGSIIYNILLSNPSFFNKTKWPKMVLPNLKHEGERIRKNAIVQSFPPKSVLITGKVLWGRRCSPRHRQSPWAEESGEATRALSVMLQTHKQFVLKMGN